MSWLCNFGMHQYKDKGMPTKANGVGKYIWKQRQVCTKCGTSRLVISKRMNTKIRKKA